MTDRPRTERRAVRSADPSLSPEANQRLTDELREIVGRDVAEAEHPDPDTAALLEAQGVGDPDRLLEDLVEEFREPGPA